VSKRKPILPANKSAPAGKGGALKQNGLRAFQRSDFTAAIKEWSSFDLKAEPSAGPALAEAHFRRALNTPDPLQRTADLTRAAELAPTEGRFWYHLGLAHHRAGRLDEARTAYARAAAAGFARRPLGFTRGLVEVECDTRVDGARLTAVSGDEAVSLIPIVALLRGDLKAVLASGTSSWIERLRGQARGDAVTALWRGLAYLAAGQVTQAAETLGARTNSTLPGGAEAVRIFYRGLALVASGDRTGALAEWGKLHERDQFPRVAAAVASAYTSQVRADLEAGRWSEVVKATDSAFALPGPSRQQPALLTAAIVARNRLANEAVARGAWAEAIPHWQHMADLLESAPALGPRGPILHNLAIAYEATEQWGAAAEAWTVLMNTLPRRQPKAKATTAVPLDRVAALPVAEKRAWLRRRVLTCYQKADQPDAAITHYRAAVKADPDDLDLRLELAEALFANEQEIAGRNELRRILERDPHHQGASAKLAEFHQMRGEWWEAERLYRDVLAIDPDNDSAKHGLAELLRERGHEQFNQGYHAGARDTYAAALKLAPDDVDLLASIGFAELVSNDEAGARGHFEAALAKGTPDAYQQVMDRWASHRNLDEFRAVLARAEAAGVASSHLYVDATGMCFRMARPGDFEFPPQLGSPRKPAAKLSKPVDPWDELGTALLQKVQATGGDRADVCQHVVAELGPIRPALALPFAEKAAALLPDDPTQQMMLALLLGLNDRRREAKETLRKATQLARKRGDTGMIAEIEGLRHAMDDPFFGMMSRFLPALGGFPDEDLF
jgi:tetratricopeptide (TPR) repeat protein